MRHEEKPASANQLLEAIKRQGGLCAITNVDVRSKPMPLWVGGRLYAVTGRALIMIRNAGSLTQLAQVGHLTHRFLLKIEELNRPAVALAIEQTLANIRQEQAAGLTNASAQSPKPTLPTKAINKPPSHQNATSSSASAGSLDF